MRLTSVLPMFLTENMLGALISYQSFFVNGSTLRDERTLGVSRRPIVIPQALNAHRSRRRFVVARGESETFFDFDTEKRDSAQPDDGATRDDER